MEKEPKVTREAKLKEAAFRMDLIALNDEAKMSFIRDGLVPFCINGVNDIYCIRKGTVDNITAFENEHQAMVYAVVYAATGVGNMESFFYVSDWEEEWEMDRADLADGYSMTWTENLTYPQFSEFGSIGFVRTDIGGIKRVS